MKWLIKRIFQAVLTVFVVITSTFLLIRWLPGGPMDYLMGKLLQEGRDPAEAQAAVELYLRINPEQPPLQQYIEYMTSVLSGDLGRSIWYNQPVSEILLGALPWTIFYGATGLFFGFLISVSLGAYMAYKEGTTFDYTSTGICLGIMSLPSYIIGIVLLYIFAYQGGLFPIAGRMSSAVSPGISLAFFLDVLHHGALLILTVTIAGVGGRSISMRGNSISIMGEDYLHVARLRGLTERRIALRYVGRNAMLPLYTSLLIQIGNILSGSVILEKVFSYPGVGFFLYRGVVARDMPLMMGAFLIITLAVVTMLFVADLTYGIIDPRIRTEGDQA